MAARRTQKNTSITLGSHFSSFIREQMSTGRFGSASEVVRAGLRMLEEHEAKLASLRSALEEGEESGFAKGYNLQQVFAAIERETR